MEKKIDLLTNNYNTYQLSSHLYNYYINNSDYIALSSLIKQGIYLSIQKKYDNVDVTILRPNALKLNTDPKIMSDILKQFSSLKNNNDKITFLNEVFKKYWQKKEFTLKKNNKHKRQYYEK